MRGRSGLLTGSVPDAAHVIRERSDNESPFEMARYVASVETSWDREATFSYLADFASIADWDPGVARARQLDRGEPVAVGARFGVVSTVGPGETPLVYETVEVDPPRRVLLRADAGTVLSLDEMTFDLRPGGGTIVTYAADLRLKGPLRLLDPPMRLWLRRIGDAARDGLRQRLAEVPPVGAAAGHG